MDVKFDNVVVEYGKTRVLHGVSGKALCGQILAIIGPSGAGKTTLLNVLAGRIRMTSGSVTLGNQQANKRLKRHIAYVTQEDVFFPNITLKETLMFSAMLRLPDSMAYSEKLQRVETIVKQFDLSKCIDTIMGDVTVRGLSGGERKRANIACEMINNVDVIIVDEPTSGLNSAIAYQVMNVLQAYTETEHKTAIVTLHQPSSRIFHMCADIMVLSSRKVTYSGAENGLVEFLANIGLQCPSYYNPADFILEQLKENTECEERMVQAALSARDNTNNSPVMKETPDDCQFKTGQVNHGFQPDSSTAVTIFEEADVECTTKWKTGFWTQYKMLCRREFKQTAGIFFSTTNIAANVFLAILVGLLWFQVPATPDKVHFRLGLIFYSHVYFGFAVARITVASYKMAKTIIVRERAAGMYRLSAYYLSKVTIEMFLNTIEPFFFYVFVYWMAGMSNEPWIFICSLLILEIAVITFAGLGLLLAIVLDGLGTVLLIANIFNVSFMILGGFYVVNDTKWFGWTKYLSILYFTTSAASKLEFLHGSGLGSYTQDSNLTMCCVDTTLEIFKIKLEESLPVWLDYVFSILYLMFYWVAGYVVLRWFKKPKSFY